MFINVLLPRTSLDVNCLTFYMVLWFVTVCPISCNSQFEQGHCKPSSFTVAGNRIDPIYGYFYCSISCQASSKRPASQQMTCANHQPCVIKKLLATADVPLQCWLVLPNHIRPERCSVSENHGGNHRISFNSGSRWAFSEFSDTHGKNKTKKLIAYRHLFSSLVSFCENTRAGARGGRRLGRHHADDCGPFGRGWQTSRQRRWGIGSDVLR